MNNVKNYAIQYRIFEDTSFYNAWFSNLKPKWGNWKVLDSYNILDNAQKTLDKLESRRPYLKYRTEYRLVKLNDREEGK